MNRKNTKGPTKRSNPSSICAALVAITCFWTRPISQANALDLDDNNSLITETIASRERLRDYDNARKFGAEAIRERDRRHVKPEGIRAGGFIVFPEIEAKTGYDDNIFSGPKAVGDLRSELLPSLKIQSNFPRHKLNFAFSGRLVDFLENSDQDYVNGAAMAETALHFDHAHTLAVRLSSELNHEERGADTAPIAAAEAVPIFLNEASVGFTRDVGRLYGTLSGTFKRRDYSDVKSLDGGTLDQDNRDSDEYSTQLRAGYRFSPGFEAIAKFRYIRQQALETKNALIDSDGYEVLAGLKFETGALLRWRLLAGYGIRDFDDPSSANYGTNLFEGQVEWLPTQRTTIFASVSRRIDSLDADDFGGRVLTKGLTRIDYEIYNNLVLKIGAGLENATYIDHDREDWTYSGQLGLEYSLNKNWTFTLNYDHEKRQSTADAFDMTRNRFLVGAKLRF